MRYLFLSICAALVSTVAVSQDYIITWQGDSLKCHMPDKPWKEGIRPARKYDNGHIRLPVFFNNTLCG